LTNFLIDQPVCASVHLLTAAFLDPPELVIGADHEVGG
jgi:hypothetical protein